MKTYGAALFFLVTALACTSNAESDTSHDELIRVYFTPFNYETYIPCTKTTIEDDAECIFQLRADRSEVEFLESATASLKPGVFESDMVRLKVIGLRGGVVFADRNGTAFHERTGVEGKMPDHMFEELKSELTRVATLKGCKIN